MLKIILFYIVLRCLHLCNINSFDQLCNSFVIFRQVVYIC